MGNSAHNFYPYKKSLSAADCKGTRSVSEPDRWESPTSDLFESETDVAVFLPFWPGPPPSPPPLQVVSQVIFLLLQKGEEEV